MEVAAELNDLLHVLQPQVIPSLGNLRTFFPLKAAARGKLYNLCDLGHLHLDMEETAHHFWHASYLMEFDKQYCK